MKISQSIYPLLFCSLFVCAEYPEYPLPDPGQLGPVLLLGGLVHNVLVGVAGLLLVVGGPAREGNAQAARLLIARRSGVGLG